ncbi:unnamed protein product, partial [Staurois parvus]
MWKVACLLSSTPTGKALWRSHAISVLGLNWYHMQKKNLAACRKAYDAFLTYFPLCHIYWKKYVDLEQHHGNEEETEKIFERAAKAIPLNVNMWISYVQFLMKTMDMALTKSVDKLR